MPCRLHGCLAMRRRGSGSSSLQVGQWPSSIAGALLTVPPARLREHLVTSWIAQTTVPPSLHVDEKTKGCEIARVICQVMGGRHRSAPLSGSTATGRHRRVPELYRTPMCFLYGPEPARCLNIPTISPGCQSEEHVSNLSRHTTTWMSRTLTQTHETLVLMPTIQGSANALPWRLRLHLHRTGPINCTIPSEYRLTIGARIYRQFAMTINALVLTRPTVQRTIFQRLNSSLFPA